MDHELVCFSFPGRKSKRTSSLHMGEPFPEQTHSDHVSRRPCQQRTMLAEDPVAQTQVTANVFFKVFTGQGAILQACHFPEGSFVSFPKPPLILAPFILLVILRALHKFPGLNAISQQDLKGVSLQ